MTTLIQNRINKINTEINEINNNIHESKHKITQLDIKYDNYLDKYKIDLIDNILKDYKFPASKQIIILQERLTSLNEIINKHNNHIQHFNVPLSTIVDKLQSLLREKQEAQFEIDKLTAKIKKFSIDTTIIKDNQIIHMLDYDFDDMKIKLNKWKQRKEYLLKNHSIISNKKMIKKNIRQLDKEIKMIYWKLVKIEIDKNNVLQELITKYQNNNHQNLTKINKEIYKHINLPVHHIVNQDNYYRFKKELKNINNYIETKYNVNQLKQDLLDKINEYQEVSISLSKVVKSPSNVIDVTRLYNKYKIIKSQINDINDHIFDLNQKYEIINDDIQEHKNTIDNIKEQKIGIIEHIKSYEISNQDILEEMIGNRVNRHKIKLNIQKKKEIGNIKNQILNYENQKKRLLTEIKTYNIVD
jgi:chromosome segregation ATPase